jgi:hypothetical protein
VARNGLAAAGNQEDVCVPMVEAGATVRQQMLLKGQPG